MKQTHRQIINNKNKFAKFAGEVYQIWISEKPAQFAAGLAYYAVFSFVPVIYLVFTISDLIFARLSVSSWFYGEVRTLLGDEVASYIQNGVTILAERTSGDTTLASLIGIVAFLLSASLIFTQLQHALNSIWHVPPPSKGATRAAIRNRILAFIMLLGVSLLLILAAVVNFVISVAMAHFKLSLVVTIFGIISLTGLATLSFLSIYKFLPNAQIAWKDVLPGAAVAGLSITILIQLLGSYLGATRFSSAIEAAGAMAVLLIGFYLLGQIFVLGAVLTRVFAALYGSGISPR